MFTGSVDNKWATVGNWSEGRLPTTTDFVCISPTYSEQVYIDGNTSAPVILGINDEASKGIDFRNEGLTLTGTSEPSAINALLVDGTGDPAIFNIDAGVTLDLTGTGSISQSQPTVNGPGTINTLKGSSTLTGANTAFDDSLQWNNYGTMTGVGAGLCVSESTPVVVTNEAKGKMNFSTGGGLDDSGGCSGSASGVVVNDAKAKITVTEASFSISALFDNEGSVIDEKNLLTGSSSGLTISAGISGLNGTDSGSYSTKTSGKKFGEISFTAPRDLSRAVLSGSGTYGFIANGIDLDDPTLASVVQQGTTSGGMVITKSLQFVYTEDGALTQTDSGTPTTTEIKSGATLTVTAGARGANFTGGHTLTVDAGGTVDDQEGGICLGPGSEILNSGTLSFVTSDIGSGEILNCGGGSSSVVNEASGSVLETDTASQAQILVPFTNDGRVSVQANSLTVDGPGTDTGSWAVDPNTNLVFASGVATLTSASTFSGTGTVEVNTNGTLGFSGQSVANVLLNGGTTTGASTITQNLTFGGFLTPGTLSDVPGTPTTTVIDSGATVVLSGNTVAPTITNGHTLLNHGDATLVVPTLCLAQGAEWDNGSGGTFSYTYTQSGNIQTCGLGGTASFVNESGATLTNSSADALSIEVPFSNSGTLAIPSGAVDITGNYSPGSTAVLAVTITGASTYGVLNVSGTATLAGTLAPSTSDFTPSDGETFQVVTSSGLGGSTFSSVTGPFTAQYTSSDVSAVAN